MRIDLRIPANANCLSFNFRFLSEEYPEFVGDALQRRLHRRTRQLRLERGDHGGSRRSPPRATSPSTATATRSGSTGRRGHDAPRATPAARPTTAPRGCCARRPRSRPAGTGSTCRSSIRATGSTTRPCSSTTCAQTGAPPAAPGSRSSATDRSRPSADATPRRRRQQTEHTHRDDHDPGWGVTRGGG